MGKEKKNNTRISDKNDHLLDVFSNDLYLELGTIEYNPLNELLQKKIVDFKDIIYYDIVKKGIGSMICSTDELVHKLPLLYFNNIVSKNKSYQLVITHGLLLRRNGYKEHFTPIILIPVKMYFENDTILFQMFSRPIINPYIKVDNNTTISEFDNTKVIDNLYDIDRYILGMLKNHTNNVRLENYLTVINIKQPEINLHQELFKLDNNIGSKLTEKYGVDGENDICTITPLDRVQRSAVAIANSGNSFAITGHDGTGKTTTLINIASNAMKDGKRVLYISNNDYTLQKVHDTFEQCKLGYYVSTFTNSFDKINDRNYDFKKSQLIQEVTKGDLKLKYKDVDALANQFANKIKNYLLIEIMEQLILTPKPEMVFNEKIMKPAYKLYKHEIKEVTKSLSKIEELMRKIPSFINSHFINIPISHNIDDVNVPYNLIEKVYSNFCILKEEKDILEKNYGFNKIENYALFKNRIKNYFNLNKVVVPTSWYNERIDENNIKDKFYNFKKASILFNQLKEEIKLSKDLENTIKSNYDIENVEFNVKKSIKDITSKYYKINDPQINNVLRDYVKIDNELEKALEYCKELEGNFAKLKQKIGITIDLKKTDILNEILEFIFVLDKGYFSRAWCDYENRDGIYKKMAFIEDVLDKYEDASKVFYKYFDNVNYLDNYIKMLVKKGKDPNKKYHGILINDLLPQLQFIREYYLKVNQMKKDYRDLTNADYQYKVHISDIYKEFIEKHNKISDKQIRIQIENSFQDLRSNEILTILSLTKEFKKSLLSVYVSYDFFNEYGLIGNANDVVEKVEQIRSIVSYIKDIVSWQVKMHNLLKDNKENILFDSYLNLSQAQDSLKEINDKINSNKEYKYLYESIFNGENTYIEFLGQLIEDFNLYLEIFDDAESLVNSFSIGYANEIIIHLRNAENIIDEISVLFQNYVKIFKTNISKYFYDDFPKIIKHFRILLDSKEELEIYLRIADEMKVLLKYKLYNLNNYIIYHDKELFRDRFNYSYFEYLYNEFINENKHFTNTKVHEQLLDSILYLEKDLMDSNAESIKAANRVVRAGKAKHLEYNQYIQKNKNGKLLFLSDSSIANMFLDMNIFDLVLIDDAHMLNANEYHKVINCNQVIISGDIQPQSSVANNLISRIRSTSIIKLKYRYSQTPLSLLLQYDNLTGRFYSDINSNKGIRSHEDDDYVLLISNLFRPNMNIKINFFTSSLVKMHSIIQNFGDVLYDKGYSVQEIYNFFKNNLNICDLSLGNFIEADYNILDLESYYQIDKEYLSNGYINNLLSCSKEIIILDSNNYLKQEVKSKFVVQLQNMLDYEIPKYELIENTIVDSISNSLSKLRIKTVGIFEPFHLLVEYENKYYGIMIVENPNNTDFTVLNTYREIKSNSMPIIMIWLSDLVENYARTINDIVKEIRV